MKTCLQCGCQSADGAAVCKTCGVSFSAVSQHYQPDATVSVFPPDTGKGRAIAAIVLGIFSGLVGGVLGIIALVEGSGATALWARGPYALAEQEAKSVRTLASIGLGIAIAVIVVMLVLVIIIFGRWSFNGAATSSVINS